MVYYIDFKELKNKIGSPCICKNNFICGEEGFCDVCVCQIILDCEEYEDIKSAYNTLYSNDKDKLRQETKKLEKYKRFYGTLKELNKKIKNGYL